ncbi:MAG TPA: hypothetical protein PLR88_00180 [Bacteroidales bacterium]|nr:hypothetical protein [Bacteroidales bacterium]
MDQMIMANVLPKKFTYNKNGRTRVFDNLVEEGCEHFFPYLDCVGLAKASDIVFLSSSHHFFYEEDELKDVKTMVNLKPLNNIKNIKSLLHNIYCLLPQRSNFVGCFVNNKKQSFFSDNKSQGNNESYENTIESRIPILNKMLNFIDQKTNRYLSPRMVTVMLEESGLKVLDMTEINGLTYFYAIKSRQSAE